MKTQSEGKYFDLKDGDVVIAAITSCTNTSNPGCDGRCGPRCPQCTSARPQSSALGEDLDGARIESCHRLPNAVGSTR